MALLTHQFVGRAEELGTFDQALGEVDQGIPSAIALIGEPGIGKSRLASLSAHGAHSEGFAVLWGACSEELADLPMAGSLPWQLALRRDAAVRPELTLRSRWQARA